MIANNDKDGKIILKRCKFIDHELFHATRFSSITDSSV